MSQFGQYLNAPAAAGVTSISSTVAGWGPLTGALTFSNGNNITVTNPAGNAISFAVTGTTNHAIQLGNGTGNLSSLAVGATGTVLIGTTGADPSFSATPTVTTMYATTFDTNVAAAGVTLAGTTLAADGTDASIDINITPKAPGRVIINGDLNSPLGTISGFNVSSSTNPLLVLTLNENGVFASSSNPLDNVDISLTTQGTGAVVIDGIAGGGLNSTWRTAQSYVQTLDATPTAITTIPLAAGEMVTITATVNGFKSTLDQSLGGTTTLSAFRAAAGNITLVGMVQTSFASTSTAVLDADVNIGTQSLRIMVTGVAAETWNFVTTYSYMYTTHP